jgi:hypothetical protein
MHRGARAQLKNNNIIFLRRRFQSVAQSVGFRHSLLCTLSLSSARCLVDKRRINNKHTTHNKSQPRKFN